MAPWAPLATTLTWEKWSERGKGAVLAARVNTISDDSSMDSALETLASLEPATPAVSGSRWRLWRRALAVPWDPPDILRR